MSMATLALQDVTNGFSRTSFSDSLETVSSSSTVPGPGAISGKFLKIVGEKTLDLMVNVIIRRRLTNIQRMLSKVPDILTNPLGEEQKQRLNEIYTDLEELCREDRKDYYPRSVQRTAASLIQSITLITRGVPASGIYPSPTNERWEILLAAVTRRRDSETLIQAGVNYNIRGVTFEPVLALPQRNQLARRHESTVLVLGIEGVGKSAISKQFKQNWDPHALVSYREVMIKSTVSSMQTILLDLNMLNIAAAVDENPQDTTGSGFAGVMAARKFILSLSIPDNNLKPNALITIGHAINLLWSDHAVRRAFSQAVLKSGTRNEAALASADYLFNSAGRIFSPYYIPTRADILRLHIPTMGVHEHVVDIGDSALRFVDTSETHMKSLAHFLAPGDATVAVFVVAMTDYNKHGRGKNALQQSYESFRALVNTPLFDTIILLFNKVDAFADLLENVPMENYVTNYTGKSFFDACSYLEMKFLRLSRGKNKRIISKFVSAFDTEAMTSTLQTIQDEVNQRHARDAGSVEV